MTTKLFFLNTVVLIFLCSCSKDKVNSPSKAELLTANSSKKWNVVKSSGDKNESEPSCKTSSSIYTDNKWTFSKGGAFEFNDGIITKTDECAGCCSDRANLVGTWSIYSSEDSFLIKATGVIENEKIVPFNEDIIRARLLKLTATELIIIDGDTLTFNSL